MIAALTRAVGSATVQVARIRPLSRETILFQRLFLGGLLWLALVAPTVAETGRACAGQDLITALAPEVRDGLRAAADAVPFPVGNFWRATKDGMQVSMMGTYHLDDPRHDALMQATAPMLQAASVLLVEAGSKEEAELMAHLARDPSAILAPEGPTLVETLPPAEWQRLAQAMRDRGIPPFMASRFRGWYVTMLLSVPPCAMKLAAAGNGLDKRMIARAVELGLPVVALEPYDTALKLFDGMDAAAQLAMIRSTLALEDQAADQMATLAAPEPRMITIRPWDQRSLPSIENAIVGSGIGITPSNDGQLIRLPIPPLSAERREDLVKIAHRRAEEARVAVRNVRRDVLHDCDQLDLPEDEHHRVKERVQQLTDSFVKEIEAHHDRKVAEIREV